MTLLELAINESTRSVIVGVNSLKDAAFQISKPQAANK